MVASVAADELDALLEEYDVPAFYGNLSVPCQKQALGMALARLCLGCAVYRVHSLGLHALSRAPSPCGCLRTRLCAGMSCECRARAPGRVLN